MYLKLISPGIDSNPPRFYLTCHQARSLTNMALTCLYMLVESSQESAQVMWKQHFTPDPDFPGEYVLHSDAKGVPQPDLDTFVSVEEEDLPEVDVLECELHVLLHVLHNYLLLHLALDELHVLLPDGGGAVHYHNTA